MIKLSKRAKGILERDKKVFLTNTREDYKLVVKSGEKEFIYDVDGNKFIDFSSFISVYNMGINRKDVSNAVKKQMDILAHGAFSDYYGSELPVNFGELLVSMFPKGFGKIFLSNSGTEANEAAEKFAQIFTGRNFNLAYYGAFHGRTKGSLALTASKTIHRTKFGPFSNTIHVPFAYCYRCPLKLKHPDCALACVDYIKKYPLAKEINGKEVSAFFMEPVQGEGGYIVPPKEYFKEIRKLTEDYGILMVADEVQSGYMRTGKFLAMDHFGVTADIYTMAKSLGGGLPMGATIVKKDLGDIPKGSHSNTFGGNLAAVAGAYELLKYVKKNMKNIEKETSRKGQKIMKRLNDMKERYEIIGDVRGLGLMIGVELVKNKETKEPAIKEAEEVLKTAFQKGLVMLPAGDSTIRMIPPVTISDISIDKALDVFEDSINEVNKKMLKGI